jgi:hypothetical protein
MSDVEIDFSDDNLSIDVGSDLGEDHFKLSSKSKKKKKKKNKSILKSASFMSKPKLPPSMPDSSFQMFSNPQKRIAEQPDPPSEDDSDGSDRGEYNEEAEEGSEYSGNGDGEYYGGEDEAQPSSGYATIDDEKQDLLYKFYRLEKKGFKIAKKFNMHSDISEMRSEFKKIVKDSEVTSSVKFSKRMLIAVTSGLEFLNKRYDPLGVELNGWSETVMENVNDGDYDNVFERLYDKYAGRVNTPPELELMLSLAGSAIMFHMTSTMFKQLPNMNDISKQNPEMMQNLMKSMSGMMNQQSGAGPSNPKQAASEPPPPVDGRREMKGPSMNFGNMFPGMGPPPPMPTNRENFEVPESVLSDSGSEASSDGGVRTVSYTAGGTAKRRGRKANLNIDSENTINI